MKTILEVKKVGKVYTFRIQFINDTDVYVNFPISKIKKSAERVGLNFQVDRVQLEPISYSIASLKKHEEVMLSPGGDVLIESVGELKNIGGDYWGLVFRSATYEINLKKPMNVFFSLNGYVSNSVEIRWK